MRTQPQMLQCPTCGKRHLLTPVSMLFTCKCGTKYAFNIGWTPAKK